MSKNRIYVTFTDDELKTIERESERLGLTKSAYVHMIYKQAISFAASLKL